MTFDEVLGQVQELLEREGRVSYRALRRRFALDDDYLEDLKAELIAAKRLALDEGGTVLVWAGAERPPAVPSTIPDRPPRAYTPTHLAEKILTSRSALEGERKQVTVLFADLKGSMELLADRDPEEARQLLDPVLEHMMAAVHRFEGTVNQVMGDGIMALFGAPIAHEDHAQRACYAALAMQAAVQQYAAVVRRTHGVPLQIRVGLHSGEVVVRAISSDLHMDYTAVGQTTHLAARMEQLALPGSILVTPEVVRLADGYVTVTPLGPMAVKGLSTPLEVYEVTGAGPVRTRLQAATARGLTRFVGREAELEAMHAALERAGEGHGQVVALVGEPGVGKSRLVYECTRSHRTHGWLVLEASSVSYGKATPYLPVLNLLKAYFGIEPRDEARRVREKVAGKMLVLDEALRPTLPTLCALLDVPVEETAWQTLDPLQRRQRTLETVKHLLLRESQEQPLLVVFEDLHWIDSETQALLDSLVDSLPTARLLLLVNYRPEYQHGWGGKMYYTQLRLDPLPSASAEALLHALLGDDPGVQPLVPLLIARTDGNPLFLEESVRTLIETGALVGERGAYRLAREVTAIQMPATVQALLAARIDRLSPEDKHLLQIAAVIGTEVPFALLQAITEGPEEALHRRLRHLQAAEFLYETHLFPELAYTFKHALTHEVAYGSLLQERRRVLHARIVTALEGLAPERRSEQVEPLAHHALRGEVWDKAVAYLQQAGDRAVARSAHREALTCFEAALTVLQHLPEGPETTTRAIDLHLALRNALLSLGEEGRILDHLHQAQELAEALGDRRRLGQVAVYLTNYFLMALGDCVQAETWAERGRAIGEALGDVGLLVGAEFYLGAVAYFRGDFQPAMGWQRQVLARLAGDLAQGRFGLTNLVAVNARHQLAQSAAELGAFRDAMVAGQEGIRLAEAAAHPSSLITACSGLGFLLVRQGELTRAQDILRRGLDLCDTWDIRHWRPILGAELGYAYMLDGRLAEALPLLEQAVELSRSRSQVGHAALWQGWLAEAYWLDERAAAALPLAAQTLAETRTRRQRGAEAWTLRLLGDMTAQSIPVPAEPAAAYYRQALALAVELGMRPLQAHCHLGLGTLYARLGRHDQAGTELAAAIALYRDMEMAFWLPRAEGALQLSPDG